MASNEADAGRPAAGASELGQTILPSRIDAPSAAREAISRWLAPHLATARLEDARLLVTELVSNSVTTPPRRRARRSTSPPAGGTEWSASRSVTAAAMAAWCRTP